MKKILFAVLVATALTLGLAGIHSVQAFYVGSGYRNSATSGSFTSGGKTIAIAVGPIFSVGARRAATANTTTNTRHYAEVRCGQFPFYSYLQGPVRQGITVGGAANNSQTSPCPSGPLVNPFGGGYIWN